MYFCYCFYNIDNNLNFFFINGSKRVRINFGRSHCSDSHFYERCVFGHVFCCSEESRFCKFRILYLLILHPPDYVDSGFCIPDFEVPDCVLPDIARAPYNQRNFHCCFFLRSLLIERLTKTHKKFLFYVTLNEVKPPNTHHISKL